MEPEKRQKKTWYDNAVAACVAVTLYVLLTHLGAVTDALSVLVGYFRSVILGAYWLI